MEITVFSLGGFGSAQEQFEKVIFTHAVLEALERKGPTHAVLSSQFQQCGVGDTLDSLLARRITTLTT